jgi:hypothetical protein
MKKTIIMLFFLFSGGLYAQKLPDAGLHTIRIIRSDKTIVVQISPVPEKPPVKPTLFYYWYSANTIHSTQGGYSGQLLNGRYTEYDLNKSLKEQGFFKNGLKSGTWKTWNEDGTLNRVSDWKAGVPVSGNSVSFWRKTKRFIGNLFPRHADSVKKSN